MKLEEYQAGIPQAQTEGQVVATQRMSATFSESPSATLVCTFLLGGIALASLVGIALHFLAREWLPLSYLFALGLQSTVFAYWIASEPKVDGKCRD